MKVTTNSRLFAHSRWDAVPVLMGLFHLAFLLSFFFSFKTLPWWACFFCGFLYSVSISWNVNSVSHNLIHNPYFRAEWLNRAFCIVESLAILFSQTMYRYVHMLHHLGNNDRRDEKGDTLDPVSIYRHGHEGEPENVFSYMFLSFFRDDPVGIYRTIKQKDPKDAFYSLVEVGSVLALALCAFILNWQAALFIACFFYFGHCLAFLNGYFRHYGSNPDLPIAWGVSSYGKLYNLLWLNNGYHAEHHYRPRVHWTQMPTLHESIRDEQVRSGVKVIEYAHVLGFLDPQNRSAIRLEFGNPKARLEPAEDRKI